MLRITRSQRKQDLSSSERMSSMWFLINERHAFSNCLASSIHQLEKKPRFNKQTENWQTDRELPGVYTRTIYNIHTPYIKYIYVTYTYIHSKQTGGFRLTWKTSRDLDIRLVQVSLAEHITHLQYRDRFLSEMQGEFSKRCVFWRISKGFQFPMMNCFVGAEELWEMHCIWSSVGDEFDVWRSSDLRSEYFHWNHHSLVSQSCCSHQSRRRFTCTYTGTNSSAAYTYLCTPCGMSNPPDTCDSQPTSPAVKTSADVVSPHLGWRLPGGCFSMHWLEISSASQPGVVMDFTSSSTCSVVPFSKLKDQFQMFVTT